MYYDFEEDRTLDRTASKDELKDYFAEGDEPVPEKL